MKKGGCFWLVLHLQDLRCMKFIRTPEKSVTAGWGIFKMQWKGREKDFCFHPGSSKWKGDHLGIFGSVLFILCWVQRPQNLIVNSVKLTVLLLIFHWTGRPFLLLSDVLTCQFKLLFHLPLALDTFLNLANAHASILGKSPVSPWYLSTTYSREGIALQMWALCEAP